MTAHIGPAANLDTVASCQLALLCAQPPPHLPNHTDMESTRISNRRINSLQTRERLQRHSSATSRASRRPISAQDAYHYALRVGYLHYLLQPRQKRVQHVPAPKPVQRVSTTTAANVIGEIASIRDSKSTKFPHGFMAELEKRVTKVLIGTEKMPEFKDPGVKRTFAVFLNAFKEPQARRNMEQDRKVEGLVLMFFSNATKEMGRGKPANDDSWRLMVDRHLALFIRLISSTLRDHDWQRDRPELLQRLQTMERKLLVHDQDLTAESQRNGGQGGTTIEVLVDRSYEVKDMPLVLIVSRIFSVSYSDVQADVNRYRDTWTEVSALQDLKTYQTNLSLMTKKTLSVDDFESEEAYELWKSQETSELSRLIMDLLQANPDLAKSSSQGAAAQLRSHNASVDLGSRQNSHSSETGYGLDHTMDALSMRDDLANGDESYTFIPSDPRSYYRAIIKEALTYDIADAQQNDGSTEYTGLLSKQSHDLLSEIALRWRLPLPSRFMLYLDVIREKYLDQELDLDTLDAAFNYVKEPPPADKKSNRMSMMQMPVPDLLSDRSKWIIHDFLLNQQILSSLHDALLRELFELMMFVFDAKAPPLGPIMYIITSHIYEDPIFDAPEDSLNEFTEQLRQALRRKAGDVYGEMLAKNIPDSKEAWEFYHVIELGRAVVKLCEKIQKRYRKTPEIMGVSPMMCLVAEMFPAYATDARDIVARIMDVAQSQGEEIPVQDGFDLYKEMVEIRRIHSDALPNQRFAFNIEGLLQDFVWRWIQMTDSNLIGWVDNAFKADQFQIESQNAVAADDERHSVSVVDMFRSFNQSIEQIVALNWDDDLQYAKFMTAVSKSIGLALARYCDLVEQKFSREMDRLTPEQEAAARQTRTQQWASMAKDLYAQKEAVAPFNFWPEVCSCTQATCDFADLISHLSN